MPSRKAWINEAWALTLSKRLNQNYPNMYFVYLLKSISYPKKTYVGYTTNLGQRLQVHNAGGSPHTAKYKPWKLHCYLAFEDKYKALNFERYLKSHAGQAFSNKRMW